MPPKNKKVIPSFRQNAGLDTTHRPSTQDDVRDDPDARPSLGRMPTPPPTPPKPKYAPPKDPKWTLQDPYISPSAKKTRPPKVWVAVFRCSNPDGIHKTKALNTTPAAEVPCHKCGYPTTMDEMFKVPPVDYRSIRVREEEKEEGFDA